MRRTVLALICTAITVAGLAGFSHIGVADDRPLVLACNDFPPLKIEHPGTDGLRGTDVEAILEIAQRSGLHLAPRFMPWKRGYAEASEGTIDGLCSCSYRADRAALFHFSDAIGETSVGIFHPPGETPEPIKSLNDLASGDIGIVGVVKGYNLESELDDAKIPHLAVSGDRQAYDMLVNHRFDHLYSFRAPIDFIARQGAGNEIAYTELRSSPYFICLSKKVTGTADMMVRINDAIAAMRKDGAFHAIQRRYGQAPIN
nr:transporter substrate-binding domain-containing protein [uncultured Dongia sp.]